MTTNATARSYSLLRRRMSVGLFGEPCIRTSGFLASATFLVALTATATPILKIADGQCGGKNPGGSCDADNTHVHSHALTPFLVPVTGLIGSNPYFIDYMTAFNNWNISLPVADRWGVSAATLSDGTILLVSTYHAYVNDCGVMCGGAEIRIDYTHSGAADPPPISDPASVYPQLADPKKIGPKDAVWSQSIRTDQKGGGSLPGNPYLDNGAGLNPPAILPPPAYPYQYSGSFFYDKPGRDADATWTGEAFITQLDYAQHKITIYDGVVWGFQVTAPEPGTLSLFGVAWVGFFAFLRKRRIPRPAPPVTWSH